jgi:Rieske Fe-S protein
MERNQREKGSIRMDRREFLLLAAAAVAAPKAGVGSLAAERLIDAGPLSDYASDGVYDRFRDQGFFVIRSGAKLIALSAYCTHRKCKLRAESDHSFSCNCHGSTFDPNGKVTEGPAKRDLSALPTTASPKGHLLVKVS